LGPRGWPYIYTYQYISIFTRSTAQGGGGSFKDRKLKERCVVVMHGWQSESIDGPKVGCDFWSGCSGHLTHDRGCNVSAM